MRMLLVALGCGEILPPVVLDKQKIQKWQQIHLGIAQFSLVERAELICTSCFERDIMMLSATHIFEIEIALFSETTSSSELCAGLESLQPYLNSIRIYNRIYSPLTSNGAGFRLRNCAHL